MTNITFSVDDDLHKKMKEHPEIKWTEILRQAIIDYLRKVEEIDVIPISVFREHLEPELLQKIEELDDQNEVSFYKKAKDMERERVHRLQELEKSANE